ncbi:MAG: SIS domain-containing protein, partial [Spirochaetales bacterium]
LQGLYQSFPVLIPLKERIAAAYFLLSEGFSKGGKVLTCGNGGSAADADHWVAELVKAFRCTRPIPGSVKESFCRLDSQEEEGSKIASLLEGGLPAISLCGNTPLLTAIANDVSSEMVFAQQVYVLGKPEDVLVCFSTSGNSKSVINAALTARALHLKVLSFTGEDGGKLKAYSDV